MRALAAFDLALALLRRICLASRGLHTSWVRMFVTSVNMADSIVVPFTLKSATQN